jgi:fimbrial chaperone protein
MKISVMFLKMVLVLGAAGLGLAAYAVTLTPIEMDFTPSGRGSTQIFRLENTTAEPAAVEISMKSRTMTLSGEDELVDADEQFNVFPSQVVLQPGQVQSVRVQYTGPAGLDKEQAFRLIAEQLPVDVGQAPANGGRMRLLVKYVASVYVMPPNLKAILAVQKTQVIDGKWLAITVQNQGKTRRILKDLTVDIGSVTLSGEALKGMAGENILAGATREFRVTLPAQKIDIQAPVRLRLP